MATSKTWTQARTLKNLNPKKRGPWKTWTLKNLDPENQNHEKRGKLQDAEKKSVDPGWQKTGERGSGAPTKWRHVARIVTLAANNIVGEKIFVRKVIYKMSRMKISTDA